MNNALSEATLSAGIRDVTDEEVEFYEEHGWVKMDGLVSPEIMEVLRKAAQADFERVGVMFGSVQEGQGLQRPEPFRSFVLGPQMGRVAHRLINRKRLTGAEIPTRLRLDLVVRRDPETVDAASERDIPFSWGSHQDSAEHGSDRVGEFNGWLALDEVTPDMGAMRFLTGVHREGPLGAGFENTLRTYPKLLDLYEWSPPFHYQPGDMTVHHGYMIHASPPNVSTKPRWSYVISYAPADTKYINGEIRNNGTLRTLPDDAKHPIVYP